MSTDSGDLFIGRGVTFTGSISVPKSASINGEINGDIKTHKLTVGVNAVISGETVANEMVVSGVLLHKTICNGLLTVLPTGKIHGSTNFEEIELHAGAVLTGKVNKS